jgi:hypothetical protein
MLVPMRPEQRPEVPETIKPWLEDIFFFVFHQVVATGGVAISAFIGTVLAFGLLRPLSVGLFSSHHARWLLTDCHFFPVQIGLGLCCGWCISRDFHHRSMLWVWILPGLALCYTVLHGPILAADPGSVFEHPAASIYSLRHYFGSGCSFSGRCLDQFLFTMPFYCSVAYSLGALFQRSTVQPSAKEA